jgi:hypothetical protein
MTLREKRSISAADFRAFNPLSQPEAAFRENVWQSGARNRTPKNGGVSSACRALIGRFSGCPGKGLSFPECNSGFDRTLALARPFRLCRARLGMATLVASQ